MPITYREDKATQASARLLQLAGGRLNHMKLVKLLYLADRKALLQFGRPITFDWYVSMPHGPVLSFTLDKINDSAAPEGTSYWHRFISERSDHEVALLGDPPRDQLSRAEEQLLDGIWNEFGTMNQWQLRDYSHSLPEWRDPKGSSVPIQVQDILLGEGFSEEEVREVVETLNAEEFAARLADA
jgi:uncharacterized phage-associated protein